MSVEALQARLAEITGRLAELSTGTGLAAPAVTAAAAAGPAGSSAAGSTAGGIGTAATAGSGSVAAGGFPEELTRLLAGAGAGLPAAGASGASAATGPTAAPAGGAGALGERVLASAREQLGVPYLWGGTTPKGFDCSGFVQYVFGQHGVSLPRVSKDQARAGVAVRPEDARPGDLVAFDNSRSRAGIDHIGIYLGDGTWIAAPRSGDVVKIQKVDLSKAVTIRRVLPDATAAVAAAALPTGAVAPGALPLGAAQPAGAAGAAWTARLPAAGQRYVPAFTAAAQATGVDARLLAAVAWTESGFRPDAVSSAGARGLMQIMPATARGLGVDPTVPDQAALGAARYLADNLRTFDGRADLALAAYNAGPSAVRKHGGIPPYAETQAYVTRVLDRFTTLGGRP